MQPYLLNIEDIIYKQKMLESYGQINHRPKALVGNSNRLAIDVSYHNGIVKFQEVKNKSNVRHVIIKAGGADIGSVYTDPKWFANLEEAQKWFPNELTAYWFASPYVSIKKQSDYFRSLVEGKQINLCIDVEWPVKKATARDLEIILEMFPLVRAWNNNIMPIIYSAAWWMNPIFAQANTSFIDWDAMKPWGAAYGPAPIPFRPFNSLMMWQYTSSGRVPGIFGDVDLNYIYDESIFSKESFDKKIPFPAVPFKAKIKSPAAGMGNSKLGGKKLMDVYAAGAEMIVHDVDNEANSVLGSFELRSWYEGSNISFDPPPEPTPIPPSPDPIPTPPIKLGFNVLNSGLAIRLAEQGIRYFMLMDIGTARTIKKRFPDSVVMVRWYQDPKKFNASTIKAEIVLAGLGLKPDDEFIVTGLNECDIVCYGTAKQIEDRARFDVEMANKIKALAPKCIYAAGTFSIGTPDYTSSEIVNAIKQYYAPHYNSGLFSLDYHGYTTNLKTGFDVWLARRWEFLFTDCGFNAKSPSRIYMGETGVDTGNGKGFSGIGASQSQFDAWVLDWKALQSKPLKDGNPSPVVGGALFQYGGNGDSKWIPFEMSGYKL